MMAFGSLVVAALSSERRFMWFDRRLNRRLHSRDYFDYLQELLRETAVLPGRPSIDEADDSWGPPFCGD
jgi:hypothetical protein